MESRYCEEDFAGLLSMEPDESLSDAEFMPAKMLPEISKTAVRNGRESAITFFDLPENVKIKILRYAGLLRPCLINIAYERFRSKHDRISCTSQMIRAGAWIHPYYSQCDHPKVPVELFLASHAARREIGTLFFAHNRFSIYFYGKAEYKIFNAATEWGLQHLRHLHVDLGPRESRFLKMSGGVHRTIHNVWINFCRDSKRRMPALRYFSMKCKVKELLVASKLMCEMDPFPTLAHCAFHFNNAQDDDIRPVIKRAAWRLTDNLNKPPFPFTQLPKEVQLLILEHVLIKRSDPYLPSSERDAGMVALLDRKSHRSTPSFLACCGTCSPLRAMCFCEGRQTAFSTSCSCFTSPLPYFLVSRGFYEDCRRLVFSKSRFTFVEEDPESNMRFMNSIPTSSFMLIRHLSFKLSASWRLYNRYLKNEDAAVLSWSVLCRFIREHFDLPRLSLSIVDLGFKENYPIGHRNKCLRKMLKTFTDLQGLRDFRVYLADDPSFEKELERALMGKANTVRYQPYKIQSNGPQQL
ncbi:hypothetical protein BJX61DRAFT_123820 [Aspergillus egyptiacus]|nr:hypothetical protein BJX61DRAFT_123820 [Aspergillus egyptiacus]